MEAKVWIVIDSETNRGGKSILGVFSSKDDAKMFIADYVLDHIVNTEYLELVEQCVR